MSVGIIDVGIGNIGSLQGSLFNQGWETTLVKRTKEINEKITHLILPGVGSFSEGMFRLNETDLVSEIYNYVLSGRPLLGICLGMQLLANEGSEGKLTKGLGLIEGKVDVINVKKEFRLPHIGWNTLNKTTNHPILNGIKPNVDFYFVHSYAFKEKNIENRIGTTHHGVEFTSFVAKNNVVGVQFHPEKSQKNGLKLIDNFCLWDGLC